MSFFIVKVEHAIAHTAQAIVHAAKAAVPFIKKAQQNETTIEGITALIDPQAVAIERAAFAVLGKVVAAIDDGQKAAAESPSAPYGVRVELASDELADLRALASALKAAAVASGIITSQAPAVVATPAGA
jgi:hypothetical protein